MLDSTLFHKSWDLSDKAVKYLVASIFVLPHWIEAYSLGKPHPRHHEYGEYIEELIDEAIYDAYYQQENE